MSLLVMCKISLHLSGEAGIPPLNTPLRDHQNHADGAFAPHAMPGDNDRDNEETGFTRIFGYFI